MSACWHWAEAYLTAGIRWHARPDGERRHHCWSFVRLLLARHYRVEVAEAFVNAADAGAVNAEFVSSPIKAGFALMPSPQDGDVVLMSGNGRATHCGLYLDVDGGRVLHCERGVGVTVDSLASLAVNGWRNLEFWRPV